MTSLSDLQIASLKCHCCGEQSFHRTKIPHSYEISHDGRAPVTISIPDLEVIQCGNPACPGLESGEATVFDQTSTRRIAIETYRQLGLLTPDEIRAGREKLGLTQAELQSLLGLGGNSLSRWEKGRIYQARSMDTLLRLAFAIPAAIRFLTARSLNEVRLRFPIATNYATQIGRHRGAPTLMKGQHAA